jgi:endonuclease IV
MNFITDEELADFKSNMGRAILQEKIDLLKSIPVYSRELYPGHYWDQIDKEDVNKMIVKLEAELNKLNLDV